MAEEEVHYNKNIIPGIQEFMGNGEVPVYYCNGFAIGYSATEAHMILNEHGKARCVIQFPFPIAKSAIDALGKLISAYQEKTGLEIKTTEELQAALIPKK